VLGADVTVGTLFEVPTVVQLAMRLESAQSDSLVVSTLRQQIVPKELLGRVLSSSRLIVMVGGPVGAALGGVLASLFAVQVAYVAAGGFLILATLVFYPVLNNRALTSATGESAG
jgi:uncharacterized protein YaaW (UPF0174 family)